MAMGNTVCWVDIPVTDIDRAAKFYSAVLAAKVEKVTEQGMEFALLPHADNNVSGCLVRSPDNRPSEHGPMVYLSVEGRLDAAIDAIGKNGGKVAKGKEQIGPYGFRAMLIDTEGNRLALHSMKG